MIPPRETKCFEVNAAPGQIEHAGTRHPAVTYFPTQDTQIRARIHEIQLGILSLFPKIGLLVVRGFPN